MPPGHSQRVQGAIFARFAGSGFAAVRVRPARVAESGVGAGANPPNALARARGGQPRTGAQGKRFSARPSAFGRRWGGRRG